MNAKYKILSQAIEKMTKTDSSQAIHPLLFLVPFVQVAWAEGFVQASERRAILCLAADIGVTSRHPDFGELLEWLEDRPTDEFFAESIEKLRDFLAELPPEQSESLRNILQIGCLKVSEAAGEIGFLRGRSRTTPEEREEVFRLGERLGFAPALA
ncbi:MAG TPA: hypothetical protein VF596_22790 [Pyrinomonadaceae bacterium]|jgi:hypothetical protein